MSEGAYFLGGPGQRNFAPHSEVPILPVPARPVRLGGRVIAQFQSAIDARDYAVKKRKEGHDVTVMDSADPQFLVCVRLLEPAL